MAKLRSALPGLLAKTGGPGPRRGLLLLGLLGLMATPARAEVRYVIAISVDGGRGDFIRDLMDEAPAEFPNFVRLRAMGASTFNARCDADFSITVPNHLSMLTGRPVVTPAGLDPALAGHGYISNFPNDGETVHNTGLYPGPYKASVWDVAHDRGLSTALYVGKQRLEILHRSWNAIYGAPDVTGANNGRDKVDFTKIVETPPPTGELMAHLVGTIQQGRLRRFTFFHMVEQDTAGHGYGWTKAAGSQWRLSFRLLDGYLGQLLDALAAAPAIGSRTAILLTADHGGGMPLQNHTDPSFFENHIIPVMMVGPGVPPGSDLVTLLENRRDPGQELPDYAAPDQPLRNGDVANLATTLLGLPPVPGSLMRPELKKPLTLTHEGGELTVSWPLYLTGYTLERVVGAPTGEWVALTDGIGEADGQYRWVGELPADGRVFFRLRAPVDAAGGKKLTKVAAKPVTKKRHHL